ncbi:MAG: GNAT family N-acetyltransferase [Clostridiales bacterium]|nr:GNAT family N-acetyltransferase [Clostridiales bacterium]
MPAPSPLPDGLSLADARKDEHFAAMSLLHALGWRDTYRGFVPDEYMAREITDDRWVSCFREDSRTGRYRGLLLYRENVPVSCINYGPARIGAGRADTICTFDSRGYEGWGEIVSLYTRPGERGKGYGGLLLEEAILRLRAAGHKNAFVFVLRENEKARSFYSAHGFTWDGSHTDIPFPPNTVCVDLRYVKTL